MVLPRCCSRRAVLSWLLSFALICTLLRLGELHRKLPAEPPNAHGVTHFDVRNRTLPTKRLLLRRDAYSEPAAPAEFHAESTGQDQGDEIFSSDVATANSSLQRGQSILRRSSILQGAYHLRQNDTTWVGRARALGSFKTSGPNASKIFDINIYLLSTRMSFAWNGSKMSDVQINDTKGYKDSRLLLKAVELSDGVFVASGYWRLQRTSIHRALQCQVSADFSIDEGTEYRRPEEESPEENLSTSPGLIALVTSEQCGLSIKLQLKPIELEGVTAKVKEFTLWANLCTLVVLFAVSTQAGSVVDSSTRVFSWLAVGMQALGDAYETSLHYAAFCSVPFWRMYASIPALKAILVLLQLRSMLIDARGAVRCVAAFLVFNVAFIAGTVVILMSWNLLPVYAILFQLYWTPAILISVRHGMKSLHRPKHLLLTSVARTFAFCVTWGNPRGPLDGKVFPKLPGAPSSALCVAAVLLQALQVAMLLSQEILGPRWFVPWVCLPGVYNYRRFVRLERATECVICMLELPPEHSRLCATTPCNHKFHWSCLEHWMERKMDCPTCRAPLPLMV